MKRIVVALLASLCLFACPVIPPVNPIPDSGTGGVAATGGAQSTGGSQPIVAGSSATGGESATGGTSAVVTFPDWDACSKQAKKAAPTVKRQFGRRHSPRSRRTVQPWHATGVVVRSVFHELLIASLDQGDLGACTGFATAGSLSSLPFGLRLTNTDGRNIYSLATKLDSFAGQWPPTDTGSDGNSAMTAAVQLKLAVSFIHADNLADMHAAIQTRDGIFGSNWTEAMSNPDPDGRARITGQILGGHEFAYVGFDKERGREVFRNSWGPLFGCNGYFWISSDDLQTLIDDGGDADFANPPN